MQIPFVKMQERFMRVGTMRPSRQRLWLGVTGLALQTLVDYKDPFVNKDTREHTAARTAARMAVTTVSGVTTREIGEFVGKKLIESESIKIPANIIEYCNKKFPTQKAKKIEYCKLMRKKAEEVAKEINIAELAKIKYARAIAAISGVAACIIALFTVDSVFTDPITNKVLNIFYGGKNWGTDKNIENQSPDSKGEPT